MTETVFLISEDEESFIIEIDYDLIQEKVTSLRASDKFWSKVERNEQEIIRLVDSEIEQAEANNARGLGSCYTTCRQKYERNEGRGRCRVNCWIDALIDFGSKYFLKKI